MNKFSIIIPTMYQYAGFLRHLKELSECTYIDEILVIENHQSFPTIINKKIKFLPQKENIYVNPAWNLGVKEAKNDIICILNDDIYFDFNRTFEFLSTINFNNIGIIGLSGESYVENYDPNIELSLEAVNARGYGFGCSMWMHKSHYIYIDENLKIIFGDQILFDMQKKQNYHILGLNTNKIVGTTGGLPLFKQRLDDDYQYYLSMPKI